MLSLATERQLAQLLNQVAETERSVERSRQDLCAHPDFDPFAAFDTIDRLGVRAISPFDCKELLLRTGVFGTIDDLELLVKQYDADSDGRMSLQDFFQLVLPSENQALRDRAEARRALLPLRPIVESMLARHLELEASRQCQLELLKRELNARPDFTTYSAFRSVDKEGLGSISRLQVSYFMRRYGYYLLDSDLDAIVRRIDTDGDMRLSYTEFSEGIRSYKAPPTVVSSSFVAASPVRTSTAFHSSMAYRTSSPLRASSPLRTSSPMRTSFRSSSPMRTSFRSSSPLRPASPPRVSSPLRTSTAYRTSSPLRASSPLRTSSPLRASSPMRTSSPLRESSMSRMTSSPYRSPARQSVRSTLFAPSPQDMSEVISVFKSQVDLARNLEDAKIELARQPDFTLLDYFRLIDLDNKGYILSTDLQGLLRDLGIAHSSDDTYLLVKHYSGLQDSRIRLSDFEAMWLPKSEYHRDLLRTRAPLSYPPTDRMQAFSSLTVLRIENAWKLYIESERRAEDLRKQMARKSWINLLDVFRSIDRNEDGFITIEEFGSVMREFGVYANVKDLESLVERYDKNLDGRVSYSEFVQEVTPMLGY